MYGRKLRREGRSVRRRGVVNYRNNTLKLDYICGIEFRNLELNGEF